MKRDLVFKTAAGLLALALALASLAGAFLLPGAAAKLAWAGLGLAGLALTGLVYAACRAETLRMASELEATLLAVEQGRLPEAGAFTGESLTHRLCLRAVRLAEATHSRAREQEASRAELQATVSDLAHQLRAPVANLTLYADTLAAGDLPPQKQAEFLAVLGGQARKLEFLVDARVKTGRLETGAIQMAPRLLPLKDTLEQAAALARPLAEAKGLGFTVDCPAELCLPHDPKWTAEAVFNLLDNAIKYTPAGRVELTARRWEMYTCIQVTDTGPGFAQDEAARLFGRFYRAPQTAAAPGVGLGLYIARQIAQLQGGYIQAKEQKRGAAFRLFLPNIETARRYQN